MSKPTGSKMQDQETDPQEGTITLSFILVYFAVFFVLGVVCILLFSATSRSFGIALVWMLGCYISGVLIGFLFGIPKILQNTKSAAANAPETRAYSVQVNTNLTEISDWLTKIIVGLGLVHLTKAPPYLRSLAQALADGLLLQYHVSALAFAYGLIVCYAVVGFLFGYLFTRLVLAKAFVMADQQSFREIIEEKLDKTEMSLVRLEANQNVLSQSVFQGSGPASEATDAPAEAASVEALLSMADRYIGNKTEGWRQRTQEKDALAEEMAAYLLKRKISKASTLSLFEENKNEGLMLAVAAATAANPEPGDPELLFQQALTVNRLHVKYRVLMAIDSMFKKGLLSDKEKKDRVTEILKAYTRHADRPLLKKIDDTRSQIGL